MADEEAGGGFYSKFASKMSSGASRLGKKAAQSDAGRNASKAAVRGAADAVHSDINRRYSEDDIGSPTVKSPTSVKSPTTIKEDAPVSTPMSEDVFEYDSDSSPDVNTRREYQQPHSSSSTQSHDHSSGQSHHQSRPPKPSFFSKLKRSKSPPRARKPAPKRDPKDRIYKSRLAKEANWDQLPMAQAQYHYKAEMKCDLEFRKGQIIRVMTRTDTQFDWWEGKLEDRVGIFPANYVKLL